MGSPSMIRFVTPQNENAADISQESLRRLVEASGLHFLLLDGRGERLIDASASIGDVCGKSRSALLDAVDAWCEIADERDRAIVAALAETPEQLPTDCELRLLRPDGTSCTATARAFVVNDGIALLFTSVTPRHTVDETDIEQLKRRCAQLEIAVSINQMSVWGLTLPTSNFGEAVFVDLHRAPGFGPGGPTLLASLSHLAAEDAHRFMAAVQACIDGVTPEFYLEAPSYREGVKVWRSARGTVLRSPDGTPTALIGSAIDITSRKVAEDELRLAKERLESAVQLARMSGWEFAMTDGFVGHARNLVESSLTAPGYDVRIEGDFLTALNEAGVHPDDQPAMIDAIQRCVDGLTREFQIEFRSTDRAGNSGWRLARGVARRDATGRAIGFGASAIDITARKLAEEKMRLLQDLQELALRGSSVTLWESPLVDSRPRSFSAFEPFESDIATESDSIDDGASVQRAMRSLAEGQSRDFEVEHRSPGADGVIRWKLSRGLLLRDADGNPISIVGTSVDVTDLKRTQEELRHLNRVAEAANRAKDEFLANVSHEIRTPMNAILGMTELALDTQLTPEQRPWLETVKSAADNLLSIIDELLDFSKIDARKLELEVAEVSVRALVQDTILALAVRAHRKGLELLGNVHDDVPDVVLGDATRLRQVLVNLIGNAIKFTEKGEVVIDVAVASEIDDQTIELRFAVSDTGIGIPPEKHEAIFEPFAQEDTSTTRRFGGTGLGLTIAARLAALMHGSIAVQSEPGRGSTFTLTARFECPVNASPAVRTAVFPPGTRVLVVDDNPVQLRTLQAWLEDFDIHAQVAMDGMTAMDALWDAVMSRDPFDVVMIDANLRSWDGVLLASRIRERPPLASCRIITMNRWDDSGESRRADTRVDGVLRKPFTKTDLADVIERVLLPAPVVPNVSPFTPNFTGAQSLGDSNSRRILVGEDSEFNADLVRELLRRWGHESCIVGNGNDVLSHVEQGGFDLVLLDLHMPGADGIEVIRRIRERELRTGGHLPVIALTARSRKEDRERCLAAGMDEFLGKPIQSKVLWEAIERLTKRGTPLE